MARAINKEKQAYRRATYLTAIPVLAGLILFSFFAYRTIKLRQESSSLDGQIQAKTKQLDDLTKQLETLNEKMIQATSEVAESQKKLDESRAGLEKIRSGKVDPKKQATETLQRIGKSTSKSLTDEPYKPAPPSAGPWADAVVGYKDLASARASAAEAKQLGLGQILICEKQGWWRVIAVFASQPEAKMSLPKIRARFKGDWAVRDMNKWCVNRVEVEAGLCKCQGE